MNASIKISRDDVVRDIRELAAITGQTLTEAVAIAVRTELLDAHHRNEIDRRRRAVDEILRRFREAPVIGPVLTDDDFYDEDGLPK
ncbi:type II toxin-antitoxin system VapB family antitoxin [Phenylobacterium sp. 20VBR1]|uniref:Type II toxin-antitoxin system VapB family antitoxin n=1 Tax=Phenylobacterium glaciei TaxID=2803784 RepID=A0A941D5J7_9CAUL|nr:type II toxin-antitoxin system VapB family antitoxin [Phenylobacterium glaciei]MBR7621341.1 type II toxin-antitoxin system VapB family antitoxin [Phenylobacterium glaciei]QQZ49975.1 type II toxin-antitoxin system VapB family antitoxin [Phenylobacterium glaciei]